MKSVRVTLKDIARECGYTANTVSRAMRNDPRLPSATRDRIHAAAEQLGYIPNTLASSLRSGRRNTVAVIINDVQNLHFCRLLSRLDPELRKADYNVMILCMKSDGALGMQMIQAAISQGVDGIIYFPNLEDRGRIEYIRGHGVPLVLMDRYAEGILADCVRSNDEQGGYLAMDHLLSLGHRKILYLAGPDYSSSQGDRLRGCRRAMAERGIGPETLRVISGGQNLANESIGDCLFPVDYTAIIAFSDEIALYALQALKKRNIHVPGEVSLVSFDHLRGDFSYLPGITSVYTEKSNAAEKTAELLLSRIADPSAPERELILPVRLYHEGSTAPVNHNPEAFSAGQEQKT